MIQKNLLDLLLVFRANIMCLVACRIELKDLLPHDELLAIKAMQSKLDEIQLFDGQERKEETDLNGEEIFQLHLYSEAANLN